MKKSVFLGVVAGIVASHLTINILIGSKILDRPRAYFSDTSNVDSYSETVLCVQEDYDKIQEQNSVLLTQNEDLSTKNSALTQKQANFESEIEDLKENVRVAQEDKKAAEEALKKEKRKPREKVVCPTLNASAYTIQIGKLTASNTSLRESLDKLQSEKYSDTPFVLIGGLQPKELGKNRKNLRLYDGEELPVLDDDKQLIMYFTASNFKWNVNDEIYFQTSAMQNSIRVRKGDFFRVVSPKGQLRILKYNGLYRTFKKDSTTEPDYTKRPWANIDMFYDEKIE